ncbi:MAG TPA: phosphoribosylformylglycinamidine cyclo-ligase [Phycisphaerales bacterium]|nr:phosphoribosylformylglycinamidine cyclo-ligase [Phycisphaerales bacterium]
MPPTSAKRRPRKPLKLTYASSGVNLEEKDTFTEGLTGLMRRTYGPRVIDNPGGFAGLFRLDFNEKLFARNHKHPVLVACADGVGTKLKLAADMRKYDTIGIDLVAMNVNDMIVQGAEPLFFLDYIATPKVDKGMLTDIVKGVTDGCVESGCALLGGETAEMPDVYAPGDFDLAGFAVGVVDLDRAIDPGRVEVGDVVLGLASDGIHSNGYSLVRKVVKSAGLDLGKVYPELENGKGKAKSEKRKAKTLGEVLLTPTRIYVKPITKLLGSYKVKKVIGGMAHITGSGMSGNLCRALHPGVDAVIDTKSWPVPAVFRFLQERGGIEEAEMRRVFNMGIGYCLVVRPAFASAIKEHLKKLGERVYVIGTVEKGTGVVREV